MLFSFSPLSSHHHYCCLFLIIYFFLSGWQPKSLLVDFPFLDTRSITGTLYTNILISILLKKLLLGTDPSFPRKTVFHQQIKICWHRGKHKHRLVVMNFRRIWGNLARFSPGLPGHLHGNEASPAQPHPWGSTTWYGDISNSASSLLFLMHLWDVSVGSMEDISHHLNCTRKLFALKTLLLKALLELSLPWGSTDILGGSGWAPDPGKLRALSIPRFPGEEL